jgi:hypothetical protein
MPAGAIAGVVPGVLPGVAERILNSQGSEAEFEVFDAMDGERRAVPNISEAKEFVDSLEMHPALGAGRRGERISPGSQGVATDWVVGPLLGPLLGPASGNG